VFNRQQILRADRSGAVLKQLRCFERTSFVEFGTELQTDQHYITIDLHMASSLDLSILFLDL
jgi:hypothetical protein